MLGADGKVYPFGSAATFGDPSGGLDGSAVSVAPTPDNKGYWIVTTTGHVFPFGSAPALGSVAARHADPRRARHWPRRNADGQGLRRVHHEGTRCLVR